MKNFFLILTIVTVSIINISCQDQSQPAYDSSDIKGYVMDANSRAELDSVTITISDLSLSTVTDNSGYFQFLYIQMPRDPLGTNLTATKKGYQPIDNWIYLKSDDTTKVTILLSRQ